MRLHLHQSLRVTLLFLFAWAINTKTTAQNGLYEVRFTVKTADCQTRKVGIALQVRSKDMAHTFYMGDANYRFDYDPRQIRSPRIAQQTNFSNLAPSSDFNYGPQNLNGSSAGTTIGTVSLNTFYTGVASGARRVDTNWTTVSCIEFEVLNGADCFGLTWHDDQRFPITGMNEVELLNDGNYNLYVVAAGGYFGNVQSCLSNNCAANPPTVNITPITTYLDSTVTICGTISDIDPNSTFTARLCNAPISGTATPSVNGSQLCVQFVPNGTVPTQPDSVCVEVCDNTNTCTQVRIPITINRRPSDPTVTPFNPITTYPDSTVTVCSNITDPDGGTFSSTICNTPQGGTASTQIVGNQVCITFVPNGSFTGQTSVCVRVCDNTGRCVETNLPVTISPRPSAPTVTPFNPITTYPDSTVTICSTISDPDGGTFTATLCNTPQGGTATPSVNGNQVCVQFVPNGSFTGQTSVCVRVCDNTGRCVETNLPVTVSPRPSAPTVTPFNPITTWTDSTITVCSNITDADGGTFSSTLCNSPQGGTASTQIVGNQVCITFVPNGSFTGQTSICVRVCDNTGLCVNTTIPITVNPRPNAPTVTPFNPLRTWIDSTVTVCSNISDPDGGTFSSTICNTPQGGTASTQIVGNQVCVTFAPNRTFTGETSICVRVCDNTGLCVTTNIPVIISARPTAPNVVPFNPIRTWIDSTVTVCSEITDPDGGTFSSTICNTPQGGTASTQIIGNQVCVTFVPNRTFTGETSICIRVCDNTGLCVNTNIPITISNRQTVDARTIIAMRKNLAPNQSNQVKLGKAVDYQIVVKNNSTFALTNVLVTDSIPTGLVLNQSNVQGWSLDASQRVASKTVASLGVGDSVILPISMVLIQGQPQTTIINKAFVLDAFAQSGNIIRSGQEPNDTAVFTITPFDPMGTIYCENTGFVLRGGKIELVSAPLNGQIIFVNDANGDPMDGRNGQYQFFTNGVPGNYNIRYVHPNGYPLSSRCTAGTTPLDPTGNDGDINDNNGDGVRDRDGLVNDILQLGSNVISGDHLQDFSCNQNPFWLTFNLQTGDPFVFNNNLPIACAVIIGSTVGIDANENGILDGTEGSLSGVTVELYRTSDLTTPIATTVTGADGKYIFDGLTQGSYKVKFVKPTGYKFTIQDAGDDSRDSDADPTTGWTQDVTLSWGQAETGIGAHFVRLSAPTIAGYAIDTVENSVLNVCIPIVDANLNDVFTPSVCGVQNGTLSNVVVNNRQVCFRYTPNTGYRGGDTICIRVCDASGQCDTALFPINLRAGGGGGRLDCTTDTQAPTIILTHPLLAGVRSGDTLTFSCVNPPLFTVRDARSTDNRDPNPRMSFVDVGVRLGSCVRDGFKVLMECDWRATDSCGNVGIFKIFVKITDTNAPTLVGVPANITVNMDLGQTLPALPNVTATDACGTAQTILWVDSIPQTGCNYNIVRTWTATDECGNTSSASQTISVLKTCACITPFATVTKTDATCGDANGTAFVGMDNPANYTFTWSANTPAGSFVNSRNGLAAGTYSVTVARNGNAACSTVVSIVINNNTANCCTTPVATPSVTAATCGNANGSATINVDNAANYAFSWSNSLGAGQTKTNLAAGSYSVTVARLSNSACSTVVNLTIQNNTQNCCTDFIPATSIVKVNNGACVGTVDVCIQTNAIVIGVKVNDSLYTRGLSVCTGGYSVKLFAGNNTVIFKNSEGCEDTIDVKVVCVETAPRSVETTMLKASKDTMLLETNELYGTRFTVTITNKTSNGAVKYAVLGGTTAIVCHALEYGADDAFAVVRDEYGVTDTTYLRTYVVNQNAFRKPIANEDVVVIFKNKSKWIDVIANDSTLGLLRGVFTASLPKNGTIAVQNNRIIYIPKRNFCGDDAFSYSICNPNGCTTGSVKVKVLCDGLRVMNGLSPNGDNVNDVLVIEGIEAYPDNALKIFNRWGNEVLNVKGYKNDWVGTWNGTILADGTYFYVLDDGKGQQYTGYIYLQR